VALEVLAADYEAAHMPSMAVEMQKRLKLYQDRSKDKR
jgi:hypothetical protein